MIQNPCVCGSDLMLNGFDGAFSYVRSLLEEGTSCVKVVFTCLTWSLWCVDELWTLNFELWSLSPSALRRKPDGSEWPHPLPRVPWAIPAWPRVWLAGLRHPRLHHLSQLQPVSRPVECEYPGSFTPTIMVCGEIQLSSIQHSDVSLYLMG